MSSPTRRYVFIDYDNLLKIKFKKLEKVCDRVFVFVDANKPAIPFSLVVQMQQMGRDVRWIPVPNPGDKSINYMICFVMGELHKRISTDVEFAVLSNDKGFDSMIEYITDRGRSCIRVKRKKSKAKSSQKPTDLGSVSPKSEKAPNLSSRPVIHQGNGRKIQVPKPSPSAVEMSAAIDNSIIQQTSRQTVQRLIRSDDRPSDVPSLTAFILLHNEEMTEPGNVDKIINNLVRTKEIKIEDQQVIYNF